MHMTPEVLALSTLGEWTGTEADAQHLEQCSECTTELAELTRAVAIGRSVVPEFLSHPSPRVWDRISAELRLSDPIGSVSELRPVQTAGSAGAQPLEHVENSPRVVARVTLESLPAWPMSSGWASVEIDAHGSRRVAVVLNGPPVTDALAEAWLIKPDLSGMVSLGLMGNGTSTFNVPSLIDLTEYSLIDVSREPLNGSVTHSGDSILRGSLV